MKSFADNLNRAVGGQWFTPDTIEEFLNTAITEKKIKLRKKKNKTPLYEITASFDTEFSSFQRLGENNTLEDCGTMYVWGFGLNGCVIIGRTYEELKEVLEAVKNRLKITPESGLAIYVHNLGADFQYIRKWFEWTEVFSLDERKPIYAKTSDGFVFKCSYVLTNSALDKVGADLNKYKVKKLSGSVDYNLIRHSKTPLSDIEIQYLVNDCLVVMAHIMECIETEGNIQKIPLTSTGYVRRYCRNACLYPKKPDGTPDRKGHWNYRDIIKRLTLTSEEYVLLKRAFAGGFTHASSFYVDERLENVMSYDLTSDYPSVIVSERFPMGKGKKIDINTIPDREALERLFKLYCCVFTVTFYDLESVFENDHYISRSKATDIKGAVVDNGRVVDADSITLTITEVDYETISKTYSWSKMEISNLWTYKRGYLPTVFIKTVLELYEKKTALKGVAGKEVDYMQSKALLNALYGMMVTDIARDVILYDDEWGHSSPEYSDVIEQYNNSENRFLSYAWGVYVTAYARKHLWQVIMECGDDYVYSDTDSVKILNADNHKEYIDSWNKWLYSKLETAMKHHGLPIEAVKPKTIKGVEKLLGAWDEDGVYDYFKTLGAKRYMTQEGDVLSITVAGVNKGKAIPFLLNKFKIKHKQDDKNPLVYHLVNPKTNTKKVFDAFQENIVFPGEYYDDNGDMLSGSGKLTHKYIDVERQGFIRDYLGNIAEFREMTALVLLSADYSMSLSQEFKDFLNGVKQKRK